MFTYIHMRIREVYKDWNTAPVSKFRVDTYKCICVRNSTQSEEVLKEKLKNIYLFSLPPNPFDYPPTHMATSTIHPSTRPFPTLFS